MASHTPPRVPGRQEALGNVRPVTPAWGRARSPGSADEACRRKGGDGSGARTSPWRPCSSCLGSEALVWNVEGRPHSGPPRKGRPRSGPRGRRLRLPGLLSRACPLSPARFHVRLSGGAGNNIETWVRSRGCQSRQLRRLIGERITHLCSRGRLPAGPQRWALPRSSRKSRKEEPQDPDLQTATGTCCRLTK